MRSLWQHAARGTRRIYDTSNVLSMPQSIAASALCTQQRFSRPLRLAKTTKVVGLRCDLHWQCMGMQAGAVGVCACIHDAC